MTSSTPVRSATRWSPACSTGGRCPRRSSSRQTCTAVMPTRRGPRTSGSHESPTKTTSAMSTPNAADRYVVDVGVRLACAGAGRRDAGVDQPQQAGFVEERVQLPAPVRAHSDGQPGVAQRGQGLCRLGVRHHGALIDGPQGIDQALDVRIGDTARSGEVAQARPHPGLVGLFADRMLAVLDPVVTGEVVVENGLFGRVAMGGEDRLDSWSHPRRRNGRGCRRSRR